jgi:hypothetical protein
LGITAPDGSVTVPTIVAFCANDTVGIKNSKRNKNGRYFRFFDLNTPSATPYNFETATCIFSPPCPVGTLRKLKEYVSATNPDGSTVNVNGGSLIFLL